MLPPCLWPSLLATAAWRQDAFLISYWVGPQVPLPDLDERFAEVAAANFTGHIGFNGGGAIAPPDPTRVAAEIAACDRHGLKCVPSICEDEHTHKPTKGGSCVGLGATSSSLWGFQLYDEPMRGDFGGLANWTTRVEADRPGLLRFINLEGAGDWGHFKTVDDYEQYVADFVSIVRPQLLSMDFYPFFPEGGVAGEPPFDAPCPASNRDCRNTKDMYGATLAVLRRQAARAPGGPIPFWNFFNAMPYGLGHYDPTEAQLRWQAMTSLAYGASGVMYFCYWAPIHVFPLGGGLIVPRARAGGGGVEWMRGPHWYEARRLNSVLRIFGDVLLGRRSTGVWRACGGDVGCPHRGIRGGGVSVDVGGGSTAACAISSLTGSGAGAMDTPSWLIGQFSLDGEPQWGRAAGERRPATPPTHTIALLVANHDDSRNVWSTVELAPFVNASSMLEVSPTHGTTSPLMDDSPWSPGVQLAIDAGGARLLLLQRAAPNRTALHCPLRGDLVHVACVDGGCDKHFKAKYGTYIDYCDAEDDSGVVDKSYSCCKKRRVSKFEGV